MMIDSDWQWLTVDDGDLQVMTVTDSNWQWLTVTDYDLWWLTVTYVYWRWLMVSYGYLGEPSKKNWFFMTFSQKTETPPLPLFWPPQFFSDKDFLDWARPPPFSAKNGKKNYQFFLYKTPIFWQIMPKIW